jgi:hypothetical protein
VDNNVFLAFALGALIGFSIMPLYNLYNIKTEVVTPLELESFYYSVYIGPPPDEPGEFVPPTNMNHRLDMSGLGVGDGFVCTLYVKNTGLHDERYELLIDPTYKDYFKITDSSIMDVLMGPGASNWTGFAVTKTADCPLPTESIVFVLTPL